MDPLSPKAHAGVVHAVTRLHREPRRPHAPPYVRPLHPASLRAVPLGTPDNPCACATPLCGGRSGDRQEITAGTHDTPHLQQQQPRHSNACCLPPAPPHGCLLLAASPVTQVPVARRQPRAGPRVPRSFNLHVSQLCVNQSLARPPPHTHTQHTPAGRRLRPQKSGVNQL